jgi:hypothetical protein
MADGNLGTKVSFDHIAHPSVWAELDQKRRDCVALSESLQQMVDWYGKRGGIDDALLSADKQEAQVARAMYLLEATNGGKG